MRILFDTNVLVDAAVRGRPYHREAVRLIHVVEQDRLDSVLAPLSLGTLWYLGTDVYDTDPRPLVQDLNQLMDLAPMGRSVLNRALDYESDTDFENMYLAEAGLSAGAEGIVTRNESDFAPTELTAYHSTELIQMLS
ncbi:MAG: type II toxin-antitoxin system VapC family toxin [Salinibacter sp.]|uniref:type II toxin-antitoxin system VapC family toxin n=1 Tax=Salinibacter sp. TaxID=2065818 RepID=UPI0035D48070